MKVILLKDVAKVGRAYEVKEIADGFARNFLIARGAGLPATPANLARTNSERARREGGAKLQSDLLNKSLEKLANRPIKIQAKASETGHLFAAIHEKEVAAALAEQAGLQMLPEMIVLDTPLKTLGEFTIKIKARQQAGLSAVEAGEFRLIIECLPS